MQSKLVEEFKSLILRVEETGDVTPLLALFSDDADICSLAHLEPMRGKEAVREFWQDYVDTFSEIRSTFTHGFETDTACTLEWASAGTLKDGHPIAYSGVTILEFPDSKIARFCTYYDTAKFIARATEDHSDAADPFLGQIPPLSS